LLILLIREKNNWCSKPNWTCN